VKGIDALDMEPPVLMLYFQFAINALEIVLSDHPFVFSAVRVEKQPLISCLDRAKTRQSLNSLQFCFFSVCVRHVYIE